MFPLLLCHTVVLYDGGNMDSTRADLYHEMAAVQ